MQIKSWGLGKTDEQSTCVRHDVKWFQKARFGRGFDLGCCVVVGPLTVDGLSTVGPKRVLNQTIKKVASYSLDFACKENKILLY